MSLHQNGGRAEKFLIIPIENSPALAIWWFTVSAGEW
jgi:hypothetical protein